MSIELLLTDLDRLAPVLGPLPWQSLAGAARPAQRAPSDLAVPEDPDSLVAQTWGVIAPASAAGDAMLAWVRPLCELRTRQAGLAPGALPVSRVPAGMTAEDARRWRIEFERRPRAERPGYLLILGDLHEVSHALQQELMVIAAVGRLCFTEPDGQPSRAGYEAYCAKVCGAEAGRATWDAAARLLLYAAHDGSVSSQDGYADLIKRCRSDAERDQRDQQLGAAGVHLFGRAEDHEWYAPEGEPAAHTLSHVARMPGPAVLLSSTHGAATTDPAAQRLTQGAVVLREAMGRQRTETLGPAFFAQPFLPRGFWFMEACFGAGTPVTSVYEHWLQALHRLGRHGQDPRDALAYLSRSSRPFVARVPQVTLAHPEGPLGVLGHVDLAWTHGYQGVDGADLASIHADHGPYYEVLRMVMRGQRFGAALASLSRRAQQLGTHLAELYGRAEQGGSETEQERGLRAWLWMRHLDLAGYILLGDPACQIPTAAARAVAEQEQARAARPLTASAGPAVDRMEEAVLACLRQPDTPPDEIARSAGVRPATLGRWLQIYREAGRRALAERGGEPGGDEGAGA